MKNTHKYIKTEESIYRIRLYNNYIPRHNVIFNYIANYLYMNE